MLDESRLHGRQTAIDGHTFNGGNLTAALRHSQRETGVDSGAIYQYRASSALAMVAALFCASQVKMLALLPVDSG
jgi:hypothetical protein